MSDSDGHSPLFWIFIGILFMGIAYLIFFIVPKLIAHYLPGLISFLFVAFLLTAWVFPLLLAQEAKSP